MKSDRLLQPVTSAAGEARLRYRTRLYMHCGRLYATVSNGQGDKKNYTQASPDHASASLKKAGSECGAADFCALAGET